MPRTPRHHLASSSHRKIPKKTTKPELASFEWVTIGLFYGLTILGILMIFNASNIEALYDFGDKYHFVKLQLVWLGIASLGFLLALVVPLQWLRRLSPYLFAATLISLVMVLIPGIGPQVQGARRWLFLGSFSFQPSELAKLSSVLYFPALLVKSHETLPLLLATGALLGLIILEPDFGTMVVVAAIIGAVYFASGAPLKIFGILLLCAFVLATGLIVSSPYRFARVKTFFEPTADPLGTSYHIRQILISLGSGGMFGSGIGRSRQKYQYLPEATTDSIFAVTAEEIGFIGATIILLMYLLAILRGLRQAARITSPYPHLVAVAVISWLAAQTLINVAAMVAVIPLTGVPLPFFSYGGSSLLMVMLALGLYGNSSRYRLIKE